MIVESKRDADGIRTISLNRPPANAINYDMMHAVKAAFVEASEDWETKVVVLDSTSERFFSAGMDVKEERPSSADLPPAIPHYGMQLGREVFRVMHECKVPVIAKVRGIAVGAGFLYACLADFAIASEKASFGQFEIKVGAVGGAGILRRMMSEQAMRYLTWTADLVPVSELVALGAGIRVVPDEDLDAEVDRVAKIIASRPTAVTRHSKYSFNQSEPGGPVDAYDVEQLHTLALAVGHHLP
ncbi:MAG: enoyl-CoA hydratase/isomerase family protein [Novosphingobium sp.]|nr:enoyl-CoA hydratase/isomerase family protein [Novosphingobium sp.]MCP5401593.1 enoyl-CoA hydratase/isomerase family protein [Novosphingobium sp.]